MPILGIGIDAVHVGRINHSLDTYKDRFKKRIYSPNEIVYCDSFPHPELHYAARFAAKEAFVKAIGTGFRFQIKHTDIEVYNDTLGKPLLKLYGRALAKINEMGVNNSHISLSHTNEIATAIVILEI